MTFPNTTHDIITPCKCCDSPSHLHGVCDPNELFDGLLDMVDENGMLLNQRVLRGGIYHHVMVMFLFTLLIVCRY